MRRALCAAVLAGAVFLVCACAPPRTDGPLPGSPAAEEGVTAEEAPFEQAPEAGDAPVHEEEMQLRVTVNGTSFYATLEENDAARAFVRLLPATLSMRELNGNEKYCYLDGALPAQAQRPGTIAAGDIMLYGTNCIVLFYESFSTSYSYTPLAKIADASVLAQAAGSASAEVTFEIIQEEPHDL